MLEAWLPVPGTDDRYYVSDLGRVRGPRFGLLKPSVLQSGHHNVKLYLADRILTRQVHGLVVLAFVGPCPAGMECRHLNGNPGDNRLANLKWGTRSENNKDAVDHGTHRNAIKAHCPAGHPYDGHNLYVLPSGARGCRACRNERSRRASREKEMAR